MALLSMNEITTFRWTFEEDLEHYQHAGYRSIGVWRQKLEDCGEERGLDLLEDSGLAVSNLTWAGGFTGSDGRTLEESIEDAAVAIRLAAAMSAGCLVLYPGGRNNHTFRHAGRLLRTALKELLPLAEDAQMPLAIEPMHPACATDWTFLTDLNAVLSLIDEIESPLLKLAYDTYHFSMGARSRQALKPLVPYLGVVHLGDRRTPPAIDQDRCPLGQGCLPLGEIVQTFLEAGYDGPFDVKLIGPEIQAGEYWMLLEQSQLAFAEYAQAVIPRSLA